MLLTEDDSDLEEDEDFMARMAEMRRQRQDPFLHFEGDTDVEEPYELEEEVVHEEHGEDEEIEEGVVPQGEKRKKLKVRKGPTVDHMQVWSNNLRVFGCHHLMRIQILVI